jgi:putative hemolysin
VERGQLVLRQAQDVHDISACQRLRYHVFYEELGAQADASAAAARLDSDRFDGICDHLMVVHTAPPPSPSAHAVAVRDGELIGTYRLLRQESAAAHGGFYTQDEFDIAPMIAKHPDLGFLELGRSCVLRPFRTKPVVELLWQGIWNYVRAHDLDVMFGCASLEGTDVETHALALSFLAQNAAAPPEWRVSAQPERYIAMNRRPAGSLDQRAALRQLPPLIKGYLRLGCFIGEGAVIDSQFNTIDVLIILPVSAISARYFARFGEPNT